MIRSSRSHETIVTIDATPEQVWSALTDPAQIVRWFASQAEVSPGEGGSMLWRWGGFFEWKTLIEVWEPNAHLRLTETRDRSLEPDADKITPARLVQDFFIESENGRTTLRVVHSGFGSGEDWDQEYEGTRGGWPHVFLVLKHMLERRRTVTAHNFSLSGFAGNLPQQEVLDRIEGLLETPHTLASRRGFERLSILPAWNESTFARSASINSRGVVYWTQFILFDMPPAEAARIESEWRDKLAQLFPA